MFYTQIWEYGGLSLATRPDTACYYIYGIRESSGRIRRISTRTADIDKAKRILIDHVEGTSPVNSTTAQPLDLLSALIGYADAQLSAKSRQDAKSILGHFQRFAATKGIWTIEAMTPKVQRDYIDWRQKCSMSQGRTLSNGTINKDLEFLRAALNYWKREGRLSTIPAVRLLPKPPPRERFLEAQEVERLIAHCIEPHLARFVLIALHTLQRPGAVLDLRCGQIDLVRRRIDFRPPGWIPSNKRRPVVPITATLLPILEQAMAESVTGHVVEYMCQPVRCVKKSFATACNRGGLQNVTPYTLRHTGATLLAAAGVPLWQISGMLGHSISRTTEIYAKHSPDFLSKAANELDALFGAMRPAA